MQYNKKSVEDIDVSGKKVIARCDFNVSGFYFNSYCFILNLINS